MRQTRRIGSMLLTVILALQFLQVEVLAANITLGNVDNPSISDTWKQTDGTRIRAYVLAGDRNLFYNFTDNNILEENGVYIRQGKIDQLSVPVLSGYEFRGALVLYHDRDGQNGSPRPCSYAFLEGGETYWHFYDSDDQADRNVGVRLKGEDKIVLCYTSVDSGSPSKSIKVSVVDPDNNPEHRVLSAPTHVDGNGVFTIRIATDSRYKAVVTAGKSENAAEQSAAHVRHVPGSDGVYEISTLFMKAASASDIIYVTVAYQPIEQIHVKVDTASRPTNWWYDFYMCVSEIDPDTLPNLPGVNPAAKLMIHPGSISLCFGEAVSDNSAVYALKKGSSNAFYVAIFTNNSLNAVSMALTNLEINGTPLNLPEAYGVYINSNRPNDGRLDPKKLSAKTVLPSGTEATLSLVESPHLMDGQGPSGGEYLQYAYLLKLENVYENISITNGSFLSTGDKEGNGKKYALLPKSLTGVELQYSYQESPSEQDWISASQGTPIDQTQNKTVYLRYRPTEGYYNPTVTLQAVSIAESQYIGQTPTPVERDGWYYLTVPRYQDAQRDYSYQVLEIKTQSISHFIKYDKNGKEPVGSFPENDDTIYRVEGTNTVYISNLIPKLEPGAGGEEMGLLSWRLYKDGIPVDNPKRGEYLDLYPGQTVPLQDLFPYELETDNHSGHTSNSASERYIYLYARWGNRSSSGNHTVRGYHIKVYVQNDGGTEEVDGARYKEITGDIPAEKLSARLRPNPVGVTVSFLDPAGWGRTVDGLQGYHYNAGISKSSTEVAIASDACIKLYFDQPISLTYRPNGIAGGRIQTERHAPGAEVSIKGIDALNWTTSHLFLGWSTEPDGEAIPAYAEENKVCLDEDLTLYAVWVAFTGIPVYYDRNAPSVAESDQEIHRDPLRYETGAEVTLRSQRDAGFFPPEGYYFTGWSTSRDGPAAYQPRDTYTVGLDADQVVFYAQWKPLPTVTYHSNTPDPSTFQQEYTPGEHVSIRNTRFFNEGYVLTSWNTSSNGMGTSYPASGGYFIMGAEDVILYAQWTQQRTITYDANNGSGHMEPQSVAQGSEIKLSKNGFQRSGYRFSGWNTNDDGSGLSYEDGQALLLISDLTLFAQWEPVYTVTYYNYGADGTTLVKTYSDQTLYKAGQHFLVSPYMFTLEGYTFTGWGTSPNGGADDRYTPGKLSGTSISANVELYAQWTKIPSTPGGGGGGPSGGGPSGGGGGSDSGGSSGGGGSGSGPVTYPVHILNSTPEGGTVRSDRKSAPKGDLVTIPTEPLDGYELDKLIVRANNGSRVSVTSKGNGKYAFTMPAGGVIVEAVFKAAEWDRGYSGCPRDYTGPIWPFTDAKPTDWYHHGVHFCLENELMVGYNDKTFRPNSATSRAMITVMLWRLNGSPVVNYAMNFADVEEGAWYTEAIRWAKSEGVAQGYGNGQFGPNDAMTREQMVTILWRYAKYKGYDVSVGEETNILSYSDASQVIGYAIPAMQWACGSGMVTGKQNGSGLILHPKGSTTRAQMATMMMRFCAEIVK